MPPQIDDETAAALDPVLSAMETARLDIVGQVKVRARWRVPLCIAGGVLFWAFGEDGRGPLEFVLKVGFGYLLGDFWASYALSEQYRRLYKDKVLPQLAARFGALTYQAVRHLDMSKLRDEKIFPEYDRVIAEDELVGIYHGLAVSIVELKLEAGSGKSCRTVFNGLLAEVELPRRLRGDTAVLPDGGPLGNFRDWIAQGSRERVRLEDPRFEAAYQVWATDQIMARALLTPAFLERFLSLAELSSIGKPLALARDERLLLILPSYGKNLFEPPSYRLPTAGRTALAELERDIAAVLAVADAVIDLDYAARAVAADHVGSQVLQHMEGLA